MSTYTTSTLQIMFSWSQTDTDDNNTSNTITDAGAYIHNKTWASGTGGVPSGQAPVIKVWKEQRTLTNGGSYIYNLTGLPVSVFSGTYNLSFNKVMGVYLENASVYKTGVSSGLSGYIGTPWSGADIALRATGVSGFSGLWNGGSGNEYLGACSMFVKTSYLSGFPIAAGKSHLFINDVGGSGATYKIGIWGI